jgi:hypothetical protein
LIFWFFCTCLRGAACATAIALAHAVGEGTVKTKERNDSNVHELKTILAMPAAFASNVDKS